MVFKRKSFPAESVRANPPPSLAASRRICILEKIISGGQTGVDRAALDFAIAHGITHGGWCPLGRLAEDGPIASRYQLTETPEPDYAQRTFWNVRDSDGTLLLSISPLLTGGSALTRDFAVTQGKPWLHLSKMRDGRTAVARLKEFIRRHHLKVLNVAGPRLSTEPAACPFAKQLLEEWFQTEATASA